MNIEKGMDEIKKEFNTLYNLYNRLKIETDRLEGSNGYIQILFKEWDRWF